MSRPFGKYAPADVAQFATAVAVFSEMAHIRGGTWPTRLFPSIATQKRADPCRHPLSGRDIAAVRLGGSSRGRHSSLQFLLPYNPARISETPSSEADLGHHCWLPAGGSRHSPQAVRGCTACVLRDRQRGSDQIGRADRIGIELPFVFPTNTILADFIVYEPDE